MRHVIAALVIALLSLTGSAHAADILSPLPVQRFVDNNGNACSGCKVFSYTAGTTTKLATYTDSTGSTPNANPIILNSRGEAQIWMPPGVPYKLVFSPSTDTDPPTNAFWTVDNVNNFAGATVPNIQNVNYTLAAADCGNTVELTGAYTTLTVPAVTGFPTACDIVVKNANTGRAQQLTGAGLPSDLAISNVQTCGANNACLWPTQTTEFKLINGAWVTQRQPGRWRANGAVFNVSPTGSDSNDCLGSGSGACATIQHAADLACFAVDAGNTNTGVLVADGTYTNAATVTTDCLAQNSLTFTGDTSTPGNVIVNITTTSGGFIGKDKGFITINGFTLRPTVSSVTVVSLGQHSNVDISNTIFNHTPSGTIISVGDNATANLLAGNHFTDNNSGSTASAFLSVSGAGRIQINNPIAVDGTWTVSNTCVADTNGVIINAGSWTGSTPTGTAALVHRGGVLTGTCPGSGAEQIADSTLEGTPSNPTGTTSATSVMMGLGSTCTITPLWKTALRIAINGNMVQATAGDGVSVALKFGAGTAPVNGAASTGTSIGANALLTNTPSSTFTQPFSISGVATGLTPGTAIWIDAAVAAQTGGVGHTASIQNVSCAAIE